MTQNIPLVVALMLALATSALAIAFTVIDLQAQLSELRQAEIRASEACQ